MDTKDIAITKAALFPYSYVFTGLAFAIPLLISGPQLLTGTLVNCLLFLSAYYLSRKNQGLMAVGPSIGALLNGLIFGTFTPYLAYLLPFIWISNMLLMNSFLALKNQGSVTRIILSSILKSAFLFVFAFAFFRLGLVPKIFLTAMGVFQLATALMGGALFLSIKKVISKQ